MKTIKTETQKVLESLIREESESERLARQSSIQYKIFGAANDLFNILDNEESAAWDIVGDYFKVSNTDTNPGCKIIRNKIHELSSEKTSNNLKILTSLLKDCEKVKNNIKRSKKENNLKKNLKKLDTKSIADTIYFVQDGNNSGLIKRMHRLLNKYDIDGGDLYDKNAIEDSLKNLSKDELSKFDKELYNLG